MKPSVTACFICYETYSSKWRLDLEALSPGTRRVALDIRNCKSLDVSFFLLSWACSDDDQKDRQLLIIEVGTTEPGAKLERDIELPLIHP